MGYFCIFGDTQQVLVRTMWNSGAIWLAGRLVYCHLIGGPWSQDDWGGPPGELRTWEKKQNRRGRQLCTEVRLSPKGSIVLHKLNKEHEQRQRGEREWVLTAHRWWGKRWPKTSGARLRKHWQLRRSLGLGSKLKSYYYTNTCSASLPACMEHLGPRVPWNPLGLCFRMGEVLMKAAMDLKVRSSGTTMKAWGSKQDSSSECWGQRDFKERKGKT